jgi:hypothetical protein
MSKSLRDQVLEAAAKVGAVKSITVDGIDEPLHVQRLSIEDRAGVADTGLPPGRRANVAAALNLVHLAVVKPERINDRLVPLLSRDEWAAWANDFPDLFSRLALAVQAAQGDADADATVALGKD